MRDTAPERSGHGVSAAAVITELERAGFTLVERTDNWGGGQYCLVFEKPR